MTDKKTSAESAAAALTGTELIRAVQGGVDVSLTPAQILTYVLAQLGGYDHPGYVSGQRYGGARTQVSNVTVAADVHYATLYRVRRPLPLHALVLWVGTGVAATAAKMSLYTNVNGRPGDLVVTAPAVATTASNAEARSVLSADVTIAPGYYWRASLFNGAPAISGIDPADQMVPEWIGGAGATNVLRASAQAVGVTGVATYAGGPPASFGAATVRTAITPHPALEIV